MLNTIGVSSLDALIDETIPASIRLKKEIDLPVRVTEYRYLKTIKDIGAKNKLFKSYIGLGYYNTIVPPVIQRNILENPGWYTQYTPYQAEIAQGRLEALLNFQTMVIDLTGMEVANASLLDEGTAAAEAMAMLHVARNKGKGAEKNVFLVSDKCFPQTIDILITRSAPLGIEIKVQDHNSFEFGDDVFGALLQYPGEDGTVEDYSSIISKAHNAGAYVTVAADLLSLTVLTPPGEMGADVVVGNTQRFGVPLGYGGPHAAYFACREDFTRLMPGRIIGVSIDAQENQALRMALQTREQHIRREKATSNICTAQALLAIMAGMYAVYHGPEGLKGIGERAHLMAKLIAAEIEKYGFEQLNNNFFDTIRIKTDDVQKIRSVAEKNKINFRYIEKGEVIIAIDQTVAVEDAEEIVKVFAEVAGKNYENIDWHSYSENLKVEYPENLNRTSNYLQHPVFSKYHSETELMRYIKKLENRDLSLTHSMIPLGSCTMKLNAAAELMPISWPEFGSIHPFVPQDQVEGYMQIISELEAYLAEITGFTASSLQPNSGAQGEYAGLMVIKAYHDDRNEHHRNIALIPSSAHGTNPASAVMAGMHVVVVKCDENGNIDVANLKSKAEQYKDNLSCLMVTYPSTHGVFEEAIIEVCQIIHDNGGLVYMDGANMNAQVGLTSPANIGADVCHLNLHKTFAIPHGGGGPGMGPICVNDKLKPYLPGHPIVKTGGEKAIPAVSAAPYGSASILLISYAYIRLLGKEGATKSTKIAILNANYIKSRLEQHYPVLYIGKNGRVAHELILDFRQFKHSVGIEVEDVAKRLIDYGFHAPTVSFPVPGTLMIEPTESESMEELDKFCDAMISIRKEIQEVVDGAADAKDNVLKHAPHTAAIITADEWNRPYSREKAAYPLNYLRERKFWPAVGRVNNPFGDRNLICSCPPMEEYEAELADANA